PEVITAVRGTFANHRAERDASGIAGDEGFGKQDQARSAGGCVSGPRPICGKGRGAIKDHGCSLDHRDSLAGGGGHDSLPAGAGCPLLELSAPTSLCVPRAAIPAVAARLSKGPPNASGS